MLPGPQLLLAKLTSVLEQLICSSSLVSNERQKKQLDHTNPKPCRFLKKQTKKNSANFCINGIKCK